MDEDTKTKNKVERLRKMLGDLYVETGIEEFRAARNILLDVWLKYDLNEVPNTKIKITKKISNG